MQVAGKNISLSELLHSLVRVVKAQDCVVTGLALDSRIVKAGDLFVACVGAKVDGHLFIEDARKRGACAVLCEKQPFNITVSENFPIIVISNLKDNLGHIAAKFYGYPSRKLTMIGVTGTNGKTSITNYIAETLTYLGVSCGVIGTLGAGVPGNFNATLNTTPDPVTLHRLLYELHVAGVSTVAMEVSSQGLEQGRVNGVDFTTGIFTNLTRDHLDYHGTLENYGAAKKRLFLEHNVKYAILNADDDFSYALAGQLTDICQVYTYTTLGKSLAGCLSLTACDIKLDPLLMQAEVTTPWGKGELQSKLLGRFNVSNLLAVLGVLGIMQIDLSKALLEIAKLQAIDGRMQVIQGNAKHPLVIIDYAHTPDALEQALVTAREYCQTGALWCIFGCGGDRDRGKRSLMGKVAELYSDNIILTNDNPRTEDQSQIVQDILSGLTCPWAVEVEYDRRAATAYAIHKANTKDVILIGGKGHERYQIFDDEQVVYSDYDTVIDIFKK